MHIFVLRVFSSLPWRSHLCCVKIHLVEWNIIILARKCCYPKDYLVRNCAITGLYLACISRILLKDCDHDTSRESFKFPYNLRVANIYFDTLDEKKRDEKKEHQQQKQQATYTQNRRFSGNQESKNSKKKWNGICCAANQNGIYHDRSECDVTIWWQRHIKWGFCRIPKL